MRSLILALLLLSGCGPSANTAGNTPQDICERESWDDPQVKLIVMRQGTNLWLEFSDPNALKNAQNQARNACLARLGARPAGGGVEPVRQPNAAYRGLF